VDQVKEIQCKTIKKYSKDITFSKLRPHNNSFEQSALGRHTACLRKRCAGSLRPVMTGLRPCFLLKLALGCRVQLEKI